MGWYRSLLVRVGNARWGTWLIVHVLSPLDRVVYRLSGGRALATGPVLFPTALLTTIGRKTGKARTLPVLYLRDGERLIIGTGNTGPHGAQWPKNVIANPRVRVRLGRATADYHVRPASLDEMARYWPEMVKVYPPYASYERRSGALPKVFVLEPPKDGSHEAPTQRRPRRNRS